MVQLQVESTTPNLGQQWAQTMVFGGGRGLDLTARGLVHVRRGQHRPTMLRWELVALDCACMKWTCIGVCRRKLVGSLPWGIPTVVVYR